MQYLIEYSYQKQLHMSQFIFRGSAAVWIYLFFFWELYPNVFREIIHKHQWHLGQPISYFFFVIQEV